MCDSSRLPVAGRPSGEPAIGPLWLATGETGHQELQICLTLVAKRAHSRPRAPGGRRASRRGRSDRLGRWCTESADWGTPVALGPRHSPAVSPQAPTSQQLERELFASPDGSAWSNLLITMRARGALCESATRNAWREIVHRHDCFRTVLLRQGDTAVQVVSDEVHAPLAVHDLAGTGGGHRRARRLGILLERLISEPLPLTEAPLARAALIRLGQREHVLCWSIAHTIFDMASWDVFTTEFIAFYAAFAAGRRPSLPSSTFRLADLAAREQSPPEHGALEYWRRQLRGASPGIALRAADGAGGHQGHDAAIALLKPAAPAYGRELRAIAKSSVHGTLAGAVSGAVACALYAYSGQSEMVFALCHANRNLERHRLGIGCLFDFLPVRLELAGNPTFRELVANVGVIVREARAHEVPFPHIRPILGGPCDVVLNFVYLPAPLRTRRLGCATGVQFETFAPARWEHLLPAERVWWDAKLDITVHALEGNYLSGNLMWNAAALDSRAVCALAAAIEFALRWAAMYPDRRIGRLITRLGERSTPR